MSSTRARDSDRVTGLIRYIKPGLGGAPTGSVAPTQPARINSPALRWHIDEITDAGVVGWIFDPNEPARRCVVVLKEGSRLLARTTAARARPGLREAGVGDGHCAFLLPLPRSLLDGEEHILHIIEEATGAVLTAQPKLWRCTAGSAGVALTGVRRGMPEAEPEQGWPLTHTGIEARTPQAGAPVTLKSRLLFDISDLVQYLGHAANLTGIQRVQVSILLALLEGALPAELAAIFLSFNAMTQNWEAIPIAFLIQLLRELFLPEQQRTIGLPAASARAGHLPGAGPFDAAALLGDGTPTVLCLLGAGWNTPDHFHQILTLKRRYGVCFAMLVHDLMPMVARETCDPTTAQEFEAFLRRAAPHTDQFLAVSQNTARDLRRFVASLGLPEPMITVTRNGSSFAEFLPAPTGADVAHHPDLPRRFVLYVSTIEGRKNHGFLLDLWRRMIAAGDEPPHLLCVGRIGWRSEHVVAELAASDYLDGRVRVLQDVSDLALRRLYANCLFTVYPSLYEGWGLPVGEALAAGKICVCSTRAALPEVAGGLAICVELEKPDEWIAVLRRLNTDDLARRRWETQIRARYRPITWSSVASSVADACDAATSHIGPKPGPYSITPYAMEISFAAANPDEVENGCFLQTPLSDASFRLGEEARGDGIWAAPEPWGTWLCEESGGVTLILGPAGESESFHVLLRLRASGPVAGAPVRISANADLVWHGGLTEKPQNIALRVRRPRGPDGLWRLDLRFEIAAKNDMRQRIMAIDRRTPYLGFERLLVVSDDAIRPKLTAVAD